MTRMSNKNLPPELVRTMAEESKEARINREVEDALREVEEAKAGSYWTGIAISFLMCVVVIGALEIFLSGWDFVRWIMGDFQ